VYNLLYFTLVKVKCIIGDVNISAQFFSWLCIVDVFLFLHSIYTRNSSVSQFRSVCGHRINTEWTASGKRMQSAF